MHAKKYGEDPWRGTKKDLYIDETFVKFQCVAIQCWECQHILSKKNVSIHRCHCKLLLRDWYVIKTRVNCSISSEKEIFLEVWRPYQSQWHQEENASAQARCHGPLVHYLSGYEIVDIPTLSLRYPPPIELLQTVVVTRTFTQAITPNLIGLTWKVKTHFNYLFMIIKMYAPSQTWISPQVYKTLEPEEHGTWLCASSYAGSSQPCIRIPHQPWRFLWLQQRLMSSEFNWSDSPESSDSSCGLYVSSSRLLLWRRNSIQCCDS